MSLKSSTGRNTWGQAKASLPATPCKKPWPIGQSKSARIWSQLFPNVFYPRVQWKNKQWICQFKIVQCQQTQSEIENYFSCAAWGVSRLKQKTQSKGKNVRLRTDAKERIYHGNQSIKLTPKRIRIFAKIMLRSKKTSLLWSSLWWFSVWKFVAL